MKNRFNNTIANKKINLFLITNYKVLKYLDFKISVTLATLVQQFNVFWTHQGSLIHLKTDNGLFKIIKIRSFQKNLYSSLRIYLENTIQVLKILAILKEL
jgi:hypothetical protein